MRRLFFIGSFIVSLVLAHAGFTKEYFQQFVHYTIRTKLDTRNHFLTGNETIKYTNNSPDTLTKFYLHLYPNAYRSKESTLIKDLRASFNFTLTNVPKAYRGYLDISDVSVDGTPVSPRIDDTIAEFDLPKSLLPGGSIEVSLSFKEKIRRHFGRAGYRGKHYDLAQWYPKVVVYDENGFHPDKFRYRGEFYGEFGNFDVFIDVPENYVVAATGVLRAGDPGWALNAPDSKTRRSSSGSEGAYKTVHFHAENVHDFAWSADPDFVVQDSTWNGIEIRSFYRKMHSKEWKDTTLVHAVRAMKWLTERIGPYPYPQVSVVDALLRGGMEYPMLVMDGYASEGLVLHEIGHIYFYGILGNDEAKEAWLDEGFTTFQSNWYAMEQYGPLGITHKWDPYKRNTPQFGVLENMRNDLFPMLRSGYGERIAMRVEDFRNDYYNIVYRKAALMLFALRYVVGEESFEKILEQYYDEWKLKHVNEERFRTICEKVSGTDLGWFFEQWLYTKKLCDYRLAEFKTRPSPRGDGYTVDIKVEREGEAIMPLELEFTFADGIKENARIDGRLRTIKKTFEFPAKPKRAAINPSNEIMDIKLVDNFVPRRTRFQIDWPNNYFYPEEAYQVRYRPGFWYNDVDGLKAGLHVKRSYMNWLNPMSVGLYYGAESERLDFSASYARQTRLLGRRVTMRLSGYKMEGRQDGRFSLSIRKRNELLRPPTQKFSIGVIYHELTNRRYLISDEIYQSGSEISPCFRYEIDPQFDIFGSKVTSELKIGREWFGGEHKYERFFTTVNLKSRERFSFLRARLRLFLGFGGGRLPFQQKFYIAGGGPLAEERRFYLRSPGAIWKDANYHEGGHGNLRGYLTGNFGANRLIALNFETGTRLPLPGISLLTDNVLGKISLMAFADVGKVLDSQNPIASSQRIQDLFDGGFADKVLVDAGLGLRSYKKFPFYNMYLRFDFPVYISQPEINGEDKEFEYRYVFSLNSTF
jgi:aminopeptidase N